MKTWSFFDPDSGLFSGRRFTGPERALAANTPEGLAAIEGEFDHLSQRVDVETGAVADYQPPQPDVDHEWNTEGKRWVKRPDVLESEASARRAMARIGRLEQQQARVIREALLAVALQLPEEQRRKLQEIDAEIESLRRMLNARPI